MTYSAFNFLQNNRAALVTAIICNADGALAKLGCF